VTATLTIAAAGAETIPRIAVRRLALARFRCFERVVLAPPPGPVVLTGANGVGKTSVLEALSLLAPGGGLRGAQIADLRRRDGAPGWAVNAVVDGPLGAVEIATGEAPASEPPRRIVRVDGKAVRGSAALGAHVAALWLTPAMERLFLDGPAVRRRFLDRLVLAFEPQHGHRLAAYERSLRARARLLREGGGDAVWLASLEAAMAGHGVAVAAARRATVRRLAAALAGDLAPFPGAEIAVAGTVEGWLAEAPAIDVEERFAGALAAARGRDAETGTTALGPHRSDLAVHHAASGLAAAQCSTGEQKALLIAIVLAAAWGVAEARGRTPLVLLDEVAAHLDRGHREALFAALIALGAQAWLTGTETAAFAGLEAARYTVAEGDVRPLAKG